MRRFAVGCRSCWRELALAGLLAASCGCAQTESSPTSPGEAAKSRASSPSAGDAQASAPAQASSAATDRSSAPSSKAGHATASQPISPQGVTPDEYRDVIAGFKGNVVLVDFWATYCGPCREKFPQTLALARKYAGKGLRVVSMSMDKPDPKYRQQVIDFLTQQNAFITNLMNRLDDTDAAFEALKIEGGALPHFKIYGRDGKLATQFGGDPDHPFSEKDVEQAVVVTLSQK